MTDAPERIWTDDECHFETRNPYRRHAVEYVRADLYTDLVAENERLKIEVGECNLVIEQQDRHAESLSLTGAVKVLEWEDCPCGKCNLSYPTNLGEFYAGSGFTPEERTLVDRAFAALASHPQDTNATEDHEEGDGE